MTSFVILAAIGCVRDLPRGPDLGPCAEPPATGGYSYAEIGIGTCLASPNALDVLEKDGRTWLVVANPDAYLNFASGSVLFVDIGSIDLGADRNLVSDLDAHALATDPFVGGLGLVRSRDRLLLPDRWSPESATKVENDEVWVVDVSDPTAPRFADEGPIQVEDDPEPIVVDDAADRAYVVNLTSHGVSVIDTTAMTLVDAAPDAAITAGAFTDGVTANGEPTRGSNAEISLATIDDATRVADEAWTLTYADAGLRVWAPDAAGHLVWTSGGDGWRANPGELRITVTDTVFTGLRDIFLGTFEGDPLLWFADNGDLSVAAWDSSARGFDLDGSAVVLTGRPATWQAHLGAPQALTLDDVGLLFYEGRTAEGSPASIGRAIGDADLTTFTRAADPVIVPPEGFTSVGDPWVRDDALAGDVRMWLSMRADDGAWHVGLAESVDNGVTWSTPTPVEGLPDGLAAPVVEWRGGRYLLWASADAGDGGTEIWTAWSYDGITWRDAAAPFTTDAPWDDVDPPRVGLQADSGGTWRVEGQDYGIVSTRSVNADTTITLNAYGINLRAAHGFEIGTTTLGEDARYGVIPGTRVQTEAVDRWYVTTLDRDLRRRIVVLGPSEDGWTVLARDLVPDGTGGNALGAGSPVVVADGAGWRMYYAAYDAAGLPTVRTATSADGLTFTPDGDRVIPADAAFSSAGQIPHSVEALSDGRVRLWYTGDNGGKTRIGAAVGTGGDLALEPGLNTRWSLGTGDPGEFDDTAVRDPLVVVGDDGVVHLWYAGFDGAQWSIGYATRASDGTWSRRTDPVTKGAIPAMRPVGGGFFAGGAYAPQAVDTADGLRIAFAGYDGLDASAFVTPRIGLARPRATAFGGAGTLGALFPEPRFATAGDRLALTTTRGAEGITAMTLEHTIGGLSTLGVGVSALVHDEERGLLYVPSKRSNLIFVLDVRDDSTGDFVDANVLSLEAALRVRTNEGPRGVRDVVPLPGTSKLLVATLQPTALMVLDVAELVDDGQAQLLDPPMLATLPLRTMAEDVNDANFTGSVDQVGPGDVLLHPDGRSVFVPQFLEDAASVFDLSLGAFGAEVAHIDPIGANPYTGAFSPDGKLLFVANLRGEPVEKETSSTIAVIDADPDSPTRWQVLTWLVNR